MFSLTIRIRISSKRRYLLLSSGVADKSGKKVQDLSRIGLDAIGPLAFTIASERAQTAHAKTLRETHDGSTLEQVGEAGIGLGAIAGLIAATFASAGPPGWLIAAGIVCAGGGSVSKIVGSSRRLDHAESTNKLNNVAELSRRLDAERRTLLHQYWYTEE